MKRDEGRRLTDAELEALEKRIREMYGGAAKNLQQIIDEYFANFRLRDEEMQKLIGTVVNGREWTEEDYKQWRLAQMGRGERFEALRDKLAERLTNANEVAISYVNDATPGIYTLNRNYAAYEVSDAGGDFTLYDEQTVRRLIVEQPDLMPYYPKEKAVRRGIDLEFGKKQITNAVTAGILMGRSSRGIAADLRRRIIDMSVESAIRAARTAVTAAENGGRQATYEKAAEMGIELQREWIATKDHRTRKWHGAADGQRVGVDEAFTVGGERLMFPGDRSHGASGWNIYNCRCAVKAFVKGHERKRETYSEWFEKMKASSEREESKNLYDSAAVSPVVKTSEYRNRFNNLDENVKIQREAYKASKTMLEHRSGTKFEDLTFIDSATGKSMTRTDYNIESEVMPSLRMRQMVTNAAPHTIIAIHNHPGNSMPSISDLQTAFAHKYKYGLIACHNGYVMRYRVTGEINEVVVDQLLDRANKRLYTDNDIKETLEQLASENVVLEVFR